MKHALIEIMLGCLTLITSIVYLIGLYWLLEYSLVLGVLAVSANLIFVIVISKVKGFI